ncbi:MAG: signal peptidase I [Candidatus Aenigmarchaeota archaeon]|nr:signal peptidase I [Candidatus Aenigmarchaeota archaeon]
MFTKKDALEIIIAFIVAWLFYQGLAVVTGTKMPIVSVVSDSMLHTEKFDNWWGSKSAYYSDLEISREDFKKFPVPRGLSCGDLLFITRDDNPRIGDVVIYSRPGSDYTIVHRIVDRSDNIYITKGDNNAAPDAPISNSQLQGRMVFAMPLLGSPRLALYYIESLFRGIPVNLGGQCSLARI